LSLSFYAAFFRVGRQLSHLHETGVVGIGGVIKRELLLFSPLSQHRQSRINGDPGHPGRERCPAIKGPYMNEGSHPRILKYILSIIRIASDLQNRPKHHFSMTSAQFDIGCVFTMLRCSNQLRLARGGSLKS
jgi:hypothetical protein